jgi:hypothetical protein
VVRVSFLQSLIRSEPVRVVQLGAGLALMPLGVVAGFTVPVPFPIGLVLFGAGLALVLRNSGWARKRYVRWKRRYPRAGKLTEFGLQRHRRFGDYFRRRPRRDAS